MKKNMSIITCILLMSSYTNPMHEIVHEVTTTTDHYNVNHEQPIQAQAEYVTHHTVPAQAIAVNETHVTAQPIILHDEQSLHDNHNQQISMTNALQDTSIIDLNSHQPNYTYNAKGQIVHELLNDGSQRLFEYDYDGTITTTIIDPVQIKQQVIIEKPDKSVITKNYNETGQQISISIKNPDGSLINKTYTQEGDLLHSTIINKNQQLESTSQLHDDGTRITQIYNPHNARTSQTIFKPEETVLNEDGTTTTTIHNPDGTITEHTKNTDYITILTMIEKSDGSKIYYHYDPSTSNLVLETHQTANNTASMKEYDAETGDLIFVTESTKDQHNYTTTLKKDTQGNKTEEIIADDEGNIIFETIFNTDGTYTTKEFNPEDDTLVSTTTMKIDDHGNTLFTTKNNKNKIIKLTTVFSDKSEKVILYNEQGKPVKTTMYDASGDVITYNAT